MNKTEKLICLMLGAVLAWYIFNEASKAKQNVAEQNGEAASSPLVSEVQKTNAVVSTEVAVASSKSGDDAASPLSKPKVELPSVPEKIVTLENDEVKLELTSWGAAVKKVTFKKYAKGCGVVSEGNPPVVMDFAAAPLGTSDKRFACELASQDGTSAVFKSAAGSRKITLGDNYRIVFEDEGFSGAMSLGSMRMGDSKNDLLSVDSWAMDAGKGKPGVIHHGDDDSPLKAYLVGGLVGGCSGSKSAAGMPEAKTIEYPGAQMWVAVKNRFFVTALASCSEPIAGFTTEVKRDVNAANYKPESVTAIINFKGEAAKRTTTFFVGPKKQSLLWDLGMKDVMEFGMWRWLCYPLVWVLNFFNGWIPNYGVAIILLTILVRLLFWPLTHKSTISMRRMSEIQPLMKEIREKFKDNPQRMQQETFALYREHKVNPMASCLPMLVQIPVFIALFNVLRACVELRYAPFLWIADLSEPEALGATSWFPFFGGLNILPILMAATMALQSALTPSTGDKNQQRMMLVMMPAMMLFMFYSFPSALSLYWTVSQVLSIAQMWYIRKRYPPKAV